MFKKIFLFVFLSVFLGAAAVAYAEAPEHVPSWDNKCGKGFQWSRGTAGCVQADCPSGAGRTYTYGCNCGEAWDKPFRTCYDPKSPGLATSCVARGAKCPGEEDKNKPNDSKPGGAKNEAPASCSIFTRTLLKLGFTDAKTSPGCSKPDSSKPDGNSKPEENDKTCSLGGNSHLNDQDKCVCDTGYERTTTGKGVFSRGKAECLSATRTDSNFGQYIKGGDIEKIQDALSSLQNKNIGESLEVEITNANDGKVVKIEIVKTGPDTYQYTSDGIRFYDYLLGAVSSSYSSAGDSTFLSNFSPFNWGVAMSGDGQKLVPDKDYFLISKIQSNIDSPLFNSIRYRKEFIVGAYEYIKARGKFSPKQILFGEQESDSLIETSIPHIRNQAIESNFDLIKRFDYILNHGGQDVGKNPIYDEEYAARTGGGRLLTDDEIAQKDIQQKIKIYAQYEIIYNRYLLAQKLAGK
ncbi:MAG: hypothetical protein WC797_01050 [Candidatus Paceibacterota bacterium]|jgi:hypothetical protein